jgi:hypothetical protein
MPQASRGCLEASSDVVDRGGLRQLPQERIRVLQVLLVEALGEPVVDGLEEVAGLGALALALPEAGVGRGGAEFEGLRLLGARDLEGSLELRSASSTVRSGLPEYDAALLWVKPCVGRLR